MLGKVKNISSQTRHLSFILSTRASSIFAVVSLESSPRTLSRRTLLQKNLHNRGTSTLPSGNISRSLGAKSYLQRNRGPATEWNLCPRCIFSIHDQVEAERQAEHVFLAYQTRPSNYRHSVLFTRITSNFGISSLPFFFPFQFAKN